MPGGGLISCVTACAPLNTMECTSACFALPVDAIAKMSCAGDCPDSTGPSECQDTCVGAEAAACAVAQYCYDKTEDEANSCKASCLGVTAANIASIQCAQSAEGIDTYLCFPDKLTDTDMKFMAFNTCSTGCQAQTNEMESARCVLQCSSAATVDIAVFSECNSACESLGLAEQDMCHTKCLIDPATGIGSGGGGGGSNADKMVMLECVTACESEPEAEQAGCNFACLPAGTNLANLIPGGGDSTGGDADSAASMAMIGCIATCNAKPTAAEQASCGLACIPGGSDLANLLPGGGGITDGTTTSGSTGMQIPGLSDLAGLGSSDTNSEILSPAATLTATSPLLLLLIALLATLMARRA